MSAWSQAAWAVNQIKNELNQSYDTQITNLANSYGEFVALSNDKINKMSTSLLSTTVPTPGSLNSNLAAGAICFIVGD